MKNKNPLTKTLIVLLLTIISIKTYAQPANDTCATAENIAITTANAVLVNTDTTAATQTLLGTCENASLTWLDQWYTFTMPVNGYVHITALDQYDYFTLYDACNGTELGCFNNDNNSYFYTLTNGATYTLKFSNEDTNANVKSFLIQGFETVTNDLCVNAENIAITTTGTITVNTNTTIATATGLTTCESEYESNNGNTPQNWLDHWYTFTMPVNGNVRITSADLFDYFALYDTCNGTELDCFNDDGFFYTLTSGAIYTLKFSNKASSANVKNFKIQAFEAIINDDCANAENIVIPTASTLTVNTSTVSATVGALLSTCENATQTWLDQWYTFTMPVNGNVRISAADLFDNFTLYDVCSGNELECFNDDGFFYTLTSGATYTLRFSNRDIYANVKSFNIQAFETAVNDECANAENIIVTTATTTTVNTSTVSATVGALLSTCENVTQTWLDQWYTFTMPVNGNVRITAADLFDNFTLYDVCSGTELECFNDDGFFYALTSGTTYTLRFSNRDIYANVKSFNIQAFETAANDECVNAENIVVTTSGTTIVNTNTVSATPGALLSTCENATQTWLDQWYTFTMPVSGNVRITAADLFDNFTLYDVCSGTELECFSNNGFFYALTSGTTYTLRFSNRDTHANIKNFNIQAFETAPNDECANAENIIVTTSETTTINTSTVSATAGALLSTCENVTQTWLDQWYTFTMPVNGNVRITAADLFDNFTLYDVCSGTELECFSNNGFFYALTSGTTYTLRFSNRDIYANIKNFNIQAFEIAANDECANAENIVITTTATTTVNTSTVSATAGALLSTCENATQTWLDQWYTFTMPVSGNVQITNADLFDNFTLYDTCGGTELNCFNNNGFFNSLTNGTTYTLRFSNRTIYADVKNFNIKVIETATNDDCIEAVNLSVGIYDEFKELKTNFGATTSGELPIPSCGNFGNGEDVWFTVEVPDSGKLTIETSQVAGSTLTDSVIQVFSGTCGNLTEIACDNDSGINSFSRVQITGRVPTEVLYIRFFEDGNDVFDTFNIYAYDNDCTDVSVWNGTSWSGGTAPTLTTIAIFDANYDTATANVNMCICKINDTATVTVNAGQYLNIAKNIINDGNLILNHQAALVQIDDAATIFGSGSFTTKIETTNLVDADRFTYFSSPVQSQNLNVFNSWADMSKLWRFDESIQDWYLVSSSTSMTPAVGFAIRGNVDTGQYPFTGTANFSGPFNNGMQSYPLTFNAGGTNDDNSLVGNPYPSAIDAALLLSSNANVNAFYFWTHNSGVVAGSFVGDDYAIWNGSGGLASGSGSAAPTGFIASGQGFFVTATGSGNLTFNNAMRVTGNNNDFRTPNTLDNDKIWLNLTNNEGLFNQILLNFSENATLGFDAKLDATRFNSNNPISFYSKGLNQEHFAIQALPILSNEDIIPLGFNVTNDAISNLKISIDHLENLEEVTIYLKDNLLNIMHDLKQSDYNFSITEATIFNDRFELLFRRNPLNTNNNSLSTENLIVTNYSENKIKIRTRNSHVISALKVYDILGKLVINLKPNKSDFIINTTINKGTVLFIKAKLENGEVLNTKFIKS